MAASTVSLTSLPPELVRMIVSQIDNPFALETALNSGGPFSDIANKDLIWEACINKWGITTYDYASDPSHKFSALGVANFIGKPMENIRRIVNHILHLKASMEAPRKRVKKDTAGSWLRSMKVEKNDEARFRAISQFLSTCGLPVHSDGLICKKLPKISINEQGPYFTTTRRVITIASALNPSEDRDDLISNIEDKKMETQRILFLTKQLLELSLCNEELKEPKDTSLEISNIHIGNILPYAHVAMRIYFLKMETTAN